MHFSSIIYWPMVLCPSRVEYLEFSKPFEESYPFYGNSGSTIGKFVRWRGRLIQFKNKSIEKSPCLENLVTTQLLQIILYISINAPHKILFCDSLGHWKPHVLMKILPMQKSIKHKVARTSLINIPETWILIKC